MNPFTYSDGHITEREFMVAFPSIMIAVAILQLPSTVANVTLYSDGWVSILFGGVIFSIFALLATHVAGAFPKQPFFSYTEHLLTRPVAIFITVFLILISIAIGSYIIRILAFTTQQYLFYQTPMEILALAFILVVVYAVSGERVGLFRLNILFLPIILTVFVLVALFNTKWMEMTHFLPLFKTDIGGYVKGVTKTFGAYYGFSIGLFYLFLIRTPKKMTKSIITGLSITTVFYILVFLVCIGVFGNVGTTNLSLPTIELAKRVEIPGGIFERIDAIVFSIWIMAIFNTTALVVDITVLLICSLYKNANKRIVTIILAPILFYISMFPQTLTEVEQASTFITIFATSFHCFIILLLFIVLKIKGAPTKHEK